MSAEEELTKLKEFAMQTTPAVVNSTRFEQYLSICRHIYQMVVQYRMDTYSKNLSNLYVFSIRFISLVTDLSQHNAAKDIANKPQLRQLQSLAQNLIIEVHEIVRPQLLRYLAEEREMELLKNTIPRNDTPTNTTNTKNNNTSSSIPTIPSMSNGTAPYNDIHAKSLTVPLSSNPANLNSLPSSHTTPMKNQYPSIIGTGNSTSIPLSPSSSLYPSLSDSLRPNYGKPSTLPYNSSSSSSSLYPSLHGPLPSTTTIISPPFGTATSATSSYSSNALNYFPSTDSTGSNNTSNISYSELHKMLKQPNYTSLSSSISSKVSTTPTAPPLSTVTLRSLHVPATLLQAFLQIAHSNTSLPPRGIETCGVLCGKVYNDKLVITHVVIPKQKGSEDNCEMLAEEELFELTTSKGIVTIGWIHTHPSQDCFMSSMDLHTHVSYQLLLPEAIAIVMAPNSNGNQYAAFRLTEGGMEVIQSCNLRGFHPHDQDWLLYENSGHITWEKPLPNSSDGSPPPVQLEIIDLRTN